MRPSVGRDMPDRSIEADRMLDAFKVNRTPILEGESPRHEFMYRSRNEDRAGLRHRLHARRDVGRIAENIGFAASALAHNHRSGLDAYPNGELQVVLAKQPLVQRRDIIYDCKPCADRSFRIVFMCLRPAEIDHQAIAKIFGNLAPKARDRSRSGSLIFGGDVAPLFWIKMCCDLRRLRQVAEQDRQMTAFTGIPGDRLIRSGRDAGIRLD